MAGSVNKVILIGNLGSDPDVRSFQNGGRVCNFSIATTETWRDRDSDEKRERTEWHNVSIFSPVLVNIAEQYLKKGSKVYIQGKLQTRKWQDQNGNDRYKTEIVLRGYDSELVLLSPRNQVTDSYGQETPASSPQISSYDQTRDFNPPNDDEIPF